MMDWIRPNAHLIESVHKARPIASPLSQSDHLATITAEDILGIKSTSITREIAMQVPSIVKGRALICGTLSRYPLIHLNNGEPAEPLQWMIRTDRGHDPHQRMLWTLDDLIFHGLSLWATQRGTRGELLDAARLPPSMWEIDKDGYITVAGERVDDDQVILFEGPQDALLRMARHSIRGALDLEASWIQRVKSPIPLVELHITDQNSDLTTEEKKSLAAEWEKSRRSGGTAVTPFEVETRMHGTTSTDLFVEGRNAIRLDIANFLNVPSSLLEGSLATATLTYSTAEGKRNELVDYSLKYWAGAIEARLSQDDVVQRGHAVQFDLSWLESPSAEPPTRKD